MKSLLLKIKKVIWLHPSHRHQMRSTLFMLGVLILGVVASKMLTPFYAVSGLAGYLPLHMLLETISVVIAMLVFVVGWNAYRQALSGNIILLAYAFFAVGVLDFSHMLSFKGMPDFLTPSSAEKAIDFWLVARTVAAVSIFVVAVKSWNISSSTTSRYIHLAVVLLSIVFIHWVFIFHDELTPPTFIVGQGLTPFKIGYEYALILLNLITACMLWYRMRKAQPFNVVGLFGVVCTMALSELFFTFYADVTDIYNLLGHIYKVISYLFLYRAVFVATIQQPYNELATSQNLLMTVINNAPIRVFWKDRDLRYLGCNAAFAKDAGLENPRDIIGKNDFQLGWADQAELYRADDKAIMESGIAKLSYDEVQTTPSNQLIWLRKSKVPLITQENESLGILGVYEEITERKAAEQRILRLSNLYKALSETNQAIVRMDNESDLFPLVCKCAVKYGGMQMAWIGQVEEVNSLILPVASYGSGLTYLNGLKISTSANIPEGQGPAGRAFRENNPVIINDFLENELTRPWHEQALKYGWNASATFPIPRNGKPFAVMSVYSTYKDIFENETVKLLVEMCLDISFALDNFDRETQRSLALDKLKAAQIAALESRDRYEDLYEFAPVGYLSLNRDGMVTLVNWKVTAMLGLPRNQINQHALVEFIADEDKDRWQALFVTLQELDGGEEFNFDMKFTHVKGAIFIANLNCLRMADENDKPILRVVLTDVTDLKQAEEFRHQVELKLQATIDAIPDLLFELDLDGRYHAAHSPNDRLLAAPRVELIGKTVQEVLPPTAAAVVMTAINEANEEGRSQGQYFELPLPDGKLWFELSVSKKASLNGETPRFILISRDITGRKQVELALQSSESHLRTIVNIEPECIKIVDARGYLKEMNPAGLAMIEADSQEQVVGQSLLELVVPECREAFAALHKRVIAGESGQLEFEVIGLKGGRRWLETHAVPMLENGEKVLLSVTRDVSEHKRAENNLRIAATAFESQEGMMVTDVNRIILRVNKAFTKITGYSAEEAVGQTPRLLSSGHHHEDFYASMWQSIAENGGWEGEVWNRRKNGEVYPQHLTITAVMDTDGVATNYVATFTDVTLRNAAEAEINHLAFYDALTRLPNRRLLIDRLNHALSAGARLGWGGALLFLDLDHFKMLNDTLGHDVGDLLLRQVAERLTSCVREGDTVARLGGDEFVVMLEDLSKQPMEAAAQAETIANKILNAINQPYQLSTNVYQATVSIGVVLFSDNEHSQDVLLKHADIAMYQAKKMGRNTLCFFDPNMQEAINARASLEVDLRKALDNKQFELYYQLQVDKLGQALGAEALIRWIHPERGLVPPFDFIPLAEETGLILPIGQWVLETACAQLKAWQATPLTQNLTLSINVSAKQFYQTNFAAQVKTTVKRYGVDAMQLKLELTESILLEHIDDTIIKMKELQKIGVQFSLDDFGTGYSSLQYLKMLPLYQLKIDRSFVRDIVIDSSDQAIVRTVIAMAQTLNLDVIAEGVETEVQREILANCDCNSYQGFLFGKPVPIEQFDLALKKAKLI
jgi:diguanylate cyclase (GGDEF)-like protein/PAS domain S-box-containing protein